VFLALGGWLAQSKLSRNKRANIIGFAVSISLMLAEGILLYANGLPKHDSMYIFLLPCMYFLFQIILQYNNHEKPKRRDIAKYIFILHPLVIVAVRGSAGVMGLNNILVGNNMIHFFAVCVVCILFSIAVMKLHNRINGSVADRGE
jgi:serine/alanine racemase